MPDLKEPLLHDVTSHRVCHSRKVITLLYLLVGFMFAVLLSFVLCSYDGARPHIDHLTILKPGISIAQENIQQARVWHSMQPPRAQQSLRQSRQLEWTLGWASGGLLHAQIGSVRKDLVPNAHGSEELQQRVIDATGVPEGIFSRKSSLSRLRTILDHLGQSWAIVLGNLVILLLFTMSLFRGFNLFIIILLGLLGFFMAFALKKSDSVDHSRRFEERLGLAVAHRDAGSGFSSPSTADASPRPGLSSPSAANVSLEPGVVNASSRGVTNASWGLQVQDIGIPSQGVAFASPGPAVVYSGAAQIALSALEGNASVFDASVQMAFEALDEKRANQTSDYKWFLNTSKVNIIPMYRSGAIALRTRMYQVQKKECMRVVMELLYLKVCHKFKQLQAPMIHSLKTGGDVNFSAINLTNLTTDVYSIDALEIVKKNLFGIIRQQATTTSVNGTAVLRMSLFQAGQVYGMSAMLGYSLRNFDQRYQLEKLTKDFGGWGKRGAVFSGANPFAKDRKAAQSLEEYIASFSPAEARRMTSLASMEVRMAMELQVTALFGSLSALQKNLKNAVGNVTSLEEANRKLQQAIDDDKVETIRITVDDLTRIVLEAVAYGALLRDAENEADIMYKLTPRPDDEPPEEGVPARLKPPAPKNPTSGAMALPTPIRKTMPTTRKRKPKPKAPAR